MTQNSPTLPAATASRWQAWQRLLVVEAVQLPFVALMIWGRWPVALWLAAGVSSLICCAGTDSSWRWRNRLLVAQSVVWLAVALALGS
jgi:hypothetical protein